MARKHEDAERWGRVGRVVNDLGRGGKKIKDRFFPRDDMAKSLGQIHTVNIFDEITTAPGARTNIDLPGELTTQLQRMIRAGQYFKLVGIDMNLSSATTLGGGQISGYFRYFAPTRGRCEAFKTAYNAMRQAMKLQGINMRTNKQYDFRVPLNDHSDTRNPFANQASLDGTNGLILGEPIGTYTEPVSVFEVYNESVNPVDAAAAGDLFSAGWNTMGVQSTPTDFVLRDEALWSGNHDFASTEYEKIPFMMSWTPDTTDLSIAFNWRPDPALYTAILCGQLQMYVEEINLDGGATDIEVEIALHVAGWKSIMGNPDKKRRRRKSSKKTSTKKTRGRKK